MKIIRDGKEINALAITYFTPKGKRFFGLDKDNEYLIYTIPDESKEKTLYLAKINHIEETIRLVLPNEEELKFLKELIENFLSDKFSEKYSHLFSLLRLMLAFRNYIAFLYSSFPSLQTRYL